MTDTPIADQPTPARSQTMHLDLTPWMPPLVSLLVSAGLAAGRMGHLW